MSVVSKNFQQILVESGLGLNKGINWLSWNNMSMSKTKGGLGFKNLYGFNITLIGKHCWNFMCNLNSLVSRLYKARNFSNCYLLNTVKGRVLFGLKFGLRMRNYVKVLSGCWGIEKIPILLEIHDWGKNMIFFCGTLSVVSGQEWRDLKFVLS